MQFAMAFKIIGVLLILFSSAMLPSLFLSVISQDGIESAFAIGFGATLAAGILLWLPNRLRRRDLNIRDGFLVTALFWIVLGLFGAIPLWITPQLDLSPISAIFESISGLTPRVQRLSPGSMHCLSSLLLYRQLLQWLGGIGIIVLAVAILPMLGIGGMQLYRAESAGPSKDRKLTPRITSTAKALFGIYLLLTVACALSYFAAGMSPFDALCHAFSTVAIGGFSTHDASLGYYEEHAILLVSSLFMLFSAINFGLHFVALQRRTARVLCARFRNRFFYHRDRAGHRRHLQLVTDHRNARSRRQPHTWRFSNDFHRNNNRVYHPRFFNMAPVFAHSFIDAELYGRLRRIDRRRHESDANFADIPPGCARTSATASPQCGDSTQTGCAESSNRSDQCGLEFFCRLYVLFRHDLARITGH